MSSISAPCSSSSLTTDSLPPAAALCAGATVISAWRLTTRGFAPRSSSSLAASSWPKYAARWRGVKPSGDQTCDERRFRLEQLLEPVGAADRGRVEDVERGIRVEDRLDEILVAVVERVQDRREPLGVALARSLRIALELVTERVLVAGGDGLEQVHPRSTGRVRHVGPPSPLREISSPL